MTAKKYIQISWLKKAKNSWQAPCIVWVKQITELILVNHMSKRWRHCMVSIANLAPAWWNEDLIEMFVTNATLAENILFGIKQATKAVTSVCWLVVPLRTEKTQLECMDMCIFCDQSLICDWLLSRTHGGALTVWIYIYICKELYVLIVAIHKSNYNNLVAALRCMHCHNQ